MHESVEYLFYKEEFQGELLPEALFNKYEVKARYFINQISFGRISMIPFTKEIKFSICAVAEKMRVFDLEGGIKSSESIGKKSINYYIERKTSREGILYKEAYIYLAGTGLLYRGVN